MPADHVPQRRLQRGDVQLAGQPDDDRDVVGRARALQLAEEPQPALRERQRHPLRTLTGPQRRPRRPVPAPASRAASPATVGASNSARIGDLDAQHRPDPRDQPDRQQRVPAQVEEVVVDADRVHAEHLGERRAQHLLLHRGRTTARHPPTYSGAGSARRSSFPFAVNGSSSSSTTAAGTMYSGSRRPTNSRSASTVDAVAATT